MLMRTGNFDGTWPCDVPCAYATSTPSDAEVDVVVGEAAPPTITTAMRAANPRVASAARSMESAVNYPTLKTLGAHVDVPMTTNTRESPVPVVYLARSSIRRWGAAEVVWNTTTLAEHFGDASDGGGGGGGGGGGSDGGSSSRHRRKRKRRASAVFVARNCRSKNGREAAIQKLSKLLRGGVDRPGQCLNSVAWPSNCEASPGGKAKKKGKCGKHAVLRRYPFYLAFENSDEEDYVSEKVFHALEAGVLPVYIGAPNVAEFVPPHSTVELRQFGGSLERLADHLHELLDAPHKYAEYFDWKRRELPESFQRRFGPLVGTHAKCRLCRWAWTRKHGLSWSQEQQRPLPTSGGARF